MHRGHFAQQGAEERRKQQKDRGVSLSIPRAALWGGVAAGLFFTLEFVCLFLALDLTTVSRASILLYSMPVWLGIAAHLWLPGERLSGARLIGM